MRKSRYFRDLWSAKHKQMRKIALGNFYPTAIFSVLFVAQSRNYCLADIIGHAHTQTRPASLRRHPIITAPKRTTTAAMAAVTGLNAHGRPVLPWPGRGGCPGCSNSAAPAQHPALVRLGCFRTELPQTRAPNSARPTRHALHPTRQQAGSGWRAGRTVGRRQHLAVASFQCHRRCYGFWSGLYPRQYPKLFEKSKLENTAAAAAVDYTSYE